MRNLVRRAAVVVGLASLASWPVYSATQLVLGRNLQVKDSGGPGTRRVSGQATERGSNDTLRGDPTTSGATLEVRCPSSTRPPPGVYPWAPIPVRSRTPHG